MPGISMNVFRQDAFSGVTLTEMINRVPYRPNLLGTLDIFEPKPILTTALQVDQKQGVLTLIPSSPRGAPPAQRLNEHRQARYFECIRLAVQDTIYASELQNVRSETEEMALKDLMEETVIRFTGSTGLTMQMEYTWEALRLSAVQGRLTDASGALIHDWYAEFGITPVPEFVFNLNDIATPHVPGSVRSLCNQIVRTMKRKGQGAFVEGLTEVHALCGDLFFDNLISDPDIVQTYLNWNAALGLRENRAFETFYFGGIFWHNYRGSDDGVTMAIASNKAAFFPVKAPGVFKVAYAPGEGFGDVNKLGKPMNVYREMDPSEEQVWVRFTVKSFPLHICTRPEMLLTATMDVTAD